MAKTQLVSLSTKITAGLLCAALSGALLACDDEGAPSDANTLDQGDVMSDAEVLADNDIVEVAEDVTADDGVDASVPPERIAELTALLDEAEPEAYADVVTDWLDAQPQIPVTEGTRALFLWQGDEDDVRMVGDATNWDISRSPSLVPLPYPGANLFYLEQTYESNARLDYKFVVDGSGWGLDPLNPRTMAGGFGANSELAMPDYETPAEVITTDAVPQGALSSHTLESAAMGDTRNFSVYVPLGADVSGPRPVVIFHDGNDYRTIIRTPVILDRLVGSGDVGPLVAVFTPPNDRVPDYNRNDDYVSYLADELVPWIRANLNAGLDPASTGTVGPSMGGLIACYTAITRSDVFGLAGCQSGAFSLDDDAMIDLVADGPKVDARIHLVVGTYELAVGGGGDEGNLLEAQRRMVTALTARGYDFAAEEHPQGHSWGLWRDRLPAALRFLYGAE